MDNSWINLAFGENYKIEKVHQEYHYDVFVRHRRFDCEDIKLWEWVGAVNIRNTFFEFKKLNDYILRCRHKGKGDDAMKTRTKYEDLALLPHVIADRICGMEYTGMEWSVNARHTRTVEEVEALRQKMTREQVDEFCKLADNRCKRAYDKQLDWFEKIVRAKGNRGRDQLYVWISHWLSSYLVDPEKMRRDDKHSEGKLDDATKELLAVAASKGIPYNPIKTPELCDEKYDLADPEDFDRLLKRLEEVRGSAERNLHKVGEHLFGSREINSR